jgi:lipopolysaccharide transport system permease protein
LSKVYFPRLILPLSLITTNLVKFGIQLITFFAVYFYFLLFKRDVTINANAYALLLPVLVLMTGLLGFGMGLIVSSLTTRYKDLVHLIGFGVQLLMFASSVVLPLSIFPERFQMVMKLNPMTGIIESFRYGFLGKGFFSWELLAYDAVCVIFIVIAGIVVFNSVEKSFVDTM